MFATDPRFYKHSNIRVQNGKWKGYDAQRSYDLVLVEDTIVYYCNAGKWYRVPDHEISLFTLH